MSKTIPPKDSDDDWFNQEVLNPSKTNERKSTRYLRNDIGVTVRQIGLFNFGIFKHQDSPVKLLDISSRGILVATKQKLAINSNISVKIRFPDFKEFELPCTVVRKSGEETQIYGIKFDSVNNKLANYLLKTQKKLTFK